MSATTQIRMVWLSRSEATPHDLPEERLVYLDHTAGFGDDYQPGYQVREKLGGMGGNRPVENLLIAEPVRYSQAEVYWRAEIRYSLLQDQYRVVGTEYEARHFLTDCDLPALKNPMLAQLSQRCQDLYLPDPAERRAPPRPPPPAPSTPARKPRTPLPLLPITLTPYNPPLEFTSSTPTNTPPPRAKPAASKPKRKPARRLPITPGRRIILED